VLYNYPRKNFYLLPSFPNRYVAEFYTVLPNTERRIYNRVFINVLYIQLHYEVQFKENGMGEKYSTL